MIVSFIDNLFGSMIFMLFKGALIGLELQELDRICAMRFVFPR